MRRRQAPEWLDEAAGAGGVRPGVEAPAGAVGALGDPHLLDGRPLVRGALAAQQIRPVETLEVDVHLEAAVVRRARVVPGALVALDAAPRSLARRVVRLPACRRGALAPQGQHPTAVLRVRRATRAVRAPRERPAHEALVRPRLLPITVDRPDLPRGGRGGEPTGDGLLLRGYRRGALLGGCGGGADEGHGAERESGGDRDQAERDSSQESSWFANTDGTGGEGPQ